MVNVPLPVEDGLKTPLEIPGPVQRPPLVLAVSVCGASLVQKELGLVIVASGV